MDTKNNIPISQIENQAITLGNDDLILVSTKNGDGTYTSKKMKFSDLKTQIPSSTPILENGTVGVIDGTLLKSPATTVTTADALNNVKSYTYAVENDCYLVIRLIQSAPDGKDIKVYVNNSLVCQEYLIDTNDFSEPTTIAFPVKKLSQVEVKLNSNFSANSTLTFFEYKLFSTSPQIGFPDYDHVQVVNLPSEWTGGDLQFIAPTDGYVSLYITSQGSDNPRWKLLVNNEIICYQDNNYGGQETLHVSMLPVRKNDTVRISYYDGGEYGNITSDSFFNFYPITSSGDVVIDDIHCGVIDGTVLTRTPKTVNVVPEVQLVYTVQNDCCLMIHEYPVGSGDSQAYDTAYYLDQNCTLPIWTHSESFQLRGETWGSMIPLKSGSNIYVRMENYADVRYTTKIEFIEYKLHDIRGQVAFPDYDATWTSILHVGNNSTQEPSSYTVLKDGYICLWCADISNGGNSNTEWKLSINSKIIFAYYADNNSSEQSTMYPVSSGDIVSWTNITTGATGGVTLTFIPVKQKYKEIQNVTTISGGGVIDGTKYTLSNGNTERILTNIVFPSDATTAIYLYTTENDCALYMECTEDSNNDIDCKYWLDAEMTCPIYKTIDKYDGDSNKGVYQGTTIFLKAGTKIYGSSPLYKGNTHLRNFRFIEYKITSINPQAAFPDWDNNKCIDLLDSNHKNQVHVSSLDDPGYTIDQNGYILYWDAQPTQNLDSSGSYYSNLYINSIIVGISHRVIGSGSVDSNQQPTIIPVSKGDVIKLYGTLRQDITGWTQSDGRTYCTFYPAKAIEQNGNQTIVGGSGGVTDGTILTDTGIQQKTTRTGNFIEVYTVQNDCLLYVWAQSSSDDRTIRLFFKQNDGSPVAVFGETMSSGSIENSRTIPVKKDTKIYADIYSDTDKQFNIRFIEYKLNSTTPQFAFPDWDSSKADTINSGDTITKNGWIVLESTGSVDSAEYIKVNGVDVTDLYTFSGDESLPGPIPVSKGDVVTYSGNISVTFYPCKTQPQPDCVSYVIESGKFNSLTGQIDPTPSNNNAWYRLYSDGWCEQGGVSNLTEIYGNESSKIISLHKSYLSTSYSILMTTSSPNRSEVGDMNYINKSQSQFTAVFDDDTGDSAPDGHEFSWKTEGFVA